MVATVLTASGKRVISILLRPITALRETPFARDKSSTREWQTCQHLKDPLDLAWQRISQHIYDIIKLIEASAVDSTLQTTKDPKNSSSTEPGITENFKAENTYRPDTIVRVKPGASEKKNNSINIDSIIKLGDTIGKYHVIRLIGRVRARYSMFFILVLGKHAALKIFTEASKSGRFILL